MQNILKNASLLDGTNGFAAVGGAIAVDEDTLGAPGRAALAVTGGTGARTTAQAVTAGLAYDCHGYWWSAGAGSLSVDWMNGATVVRSDILPVLQAGKGTAQWGVRSTYNRSYARITAPVGASSARLSLASTTSGALVKPFIGRPGLVDNQLHWDPGPSDNSDLDAILAWPTDVPSPSWDSYGAAPTSVRKAFEADSAIPQANRTGTVERTQMKCVLRLTDLQVAILGRFHRDCGDAPFYMVRPDTDELCFAQWLADGAPALQSLIPGGGGNYAVGLLLAVA